MKKSMILMGAMSTVAAPAMAQGFYADGGFQYATGADDGGDEYVGQVIGHLGYDLGSFLGIEAEGSYGILDADVGGADAGFNYTYGGFGRVNFPVGRSMRVFGRGGYVIGEFEVDNGAASFSDTYNAFAYGAGAEIWFGDGGGLGVRVDYTRYTYDDDGFDADFDAVMVGLSFKL